MTCSLAIFQITRNVQIMCMYKYYQKCNSLKEKWYRYDIIYGRMSTHLCTLSLFLFFIVPPPSVSVNSSSSAYAGTNFSLMCTIQLSTAVDTTVVINSTWCGPLGIPAGTRVVSTAPTGTGARYQTILMFRPLNTSDSGNYTCEATVSPSSESQFINASTARREIPIDVQGK